MDLTLLLTQIIGIYLLVAGLSGLFYAERMQKAMAEMTRSYLLPYFDGALALLLGLLLVLNHNVWDSAAEIIISLFGWIALVEGLALMLLPHGFIMGIAKKMVSKQAATGWSIIAILLGAYLAYMGFLV
tara:strand:+ start:310 stop:696 length:387 start_codon:yes stop_codon:yes gene_type:complete